MASPKTTEPGVKSASIEPIIVPALTVVAKIVPSASISPFTKRSLDPSIFASAPPEPTCTVAKGAASPNPTRLFWASIETVLLSKFKPSTSSALRVTSTV